MSNSTPPELRQPYLSEHREFLPEPNRIRLYVKDFDGETETFIPYEKVTTTTRTITQQDGRVYIAAISFGIFALIGFALYFIGTSTLMRWTPLWSIASVIFFGFHVYKKRKYFLLDLSDGKSIFFLANRPTEEELDRFVKSVYEARERYLREQYYTPDTTNDASVVTMIEENLALEKFLNTCRTEFRFLITDFGFQEFNSPKKEFANPFKLSFVRDDLEISIEGIRYDSAAMVLLTDKKHRILGPRNLDPAFNPFDKKVVKALPKANGQTDDIVQEARLLLEHGRDLLNGDFSVFERAFDRKTQVWAEYGKRSAFGIAVQEAVAAYEEGKWKDVVTLLEPHEASLSKKMAKKLAFARSQL